MRKHRLQRGASLVEVTTASALGVMAVMTAVGLLVMGMASWVRGESRIQAESQSQRAIRIISQELREAMMVAVDSDGAGLTYRLPRRDSSGTFTVPTTWDGVTRRIELRGENLVVTGAEGERIIARNVSRTDFSRNPPVSYPIFTPGAGAVTRQLVVTVVCQTNSYRTENSVSRTRETVFLRNIPELSRG